MTRLARQEAASAAVLDFELSWSTLCLLHAHLERLTVPTLVIGKTMTAVSVLELLHLGVRGVADGDLARANIVRIVRMITGGTLCISAGLGRRLRTSMAGDGTGFGPAAFDQPFSNRAATWRSLFDLTRREVRSSRPSWRGARTGKSPARWVSPPVR